MGSSNSGLRNKRRNQLIIEYEKDNQLWLIDYPSISTPTL